MRGWRRRDRHGVPGADRARARGKGVGIFVERINPAKSLYDRLGFKVIREEDIYLEMDWAPDGVS